MNKYDELLTYVAFFWVAIILASIVVLGPVMPIIGGLIIEIGGAVASIGLIWFEKQTEAKKSR